jgi:hypothetical protein
MSDKTAAPDELKRLEMEISALKEENKRLKSSPAAPTPRVGSKPVSAVRKISVILLVALAVALLTTANLLFWFGNTIVKNDRFIAATSPIIKDPAVQSTMALYTTNKIFDNVDVQGNITRALPPRADFLAPQLTKQLRTGVESSLHKVLATPKFQDRWNQTLAKQHQRLITLASNQKDADISVNEVFNRLTASFKNTKLAFLAGKQLPAKVGDITVLHAAWLPVAHNLVVHIDAWRFIVLCLLVVCLAGATWLSRNRRRTIYTFSLLSAAMLLASLIALRLANAAITGKADPQYSEGVSQILNIFFHPLVVQTLTLLATVFIIGTVAWVSGPSRRSSAMKREISLHFSGRLHKLVFAEDNKFTVWVQKNKNRIEWGLLAVIAAVMLLVRLTPMALFTYTFFAVALVLIVEIVSGARVPEVSGIISKRSA